MTTDRILHGLFLFFVLAGGVMAVAAESVAGAIVFAAFWLGEMLG